MQDSTDEDEMVVPCWNDMDCTCLCSSCQHAAELITAVTKASSWQSMLFLSRCHNFGIVSDKFGRTVLHVAASCGCSLAVIKMLVKSSNLLVRDAESGWTALHRALFYGQLSVARLLIAEGMDPGITDHEGLTPLDLVVRDRLPHVNFYHSGLCEVFTWGDNANYTLGHENIQRKFVVPEIVSTFSRLHVSVQQVVLSKYHTVFLTESGKVYTCGHGLGGRLGHGDELTRLVPQLVECLKNEVCVVVAAAQDHTVFLMENDSLYSCGLNNHCQLGLLPAVEKCLAPKQLNSKVLRGVKIVAICTQQLHTVICSKNTVYTFGLNAGQLGHSRGEQLIGQPRAVSSLMQKECTVSHVACTYAATVIATSHGDVFVLYQYQCRKIMSKWLDIVQVSASGGCHEVVDNCNVVNNSTSSALIVVIRTSTGKLYMWTENDQVIRRCCWTGPCRSLSVDHFALGVDSLAIISRDGQAFTGKIALVSCTRSSSQRLSRSEESFIESARSRLHELVSRDFVMNVRLERIPFIHRATSVFLDSRSANYAVLQSHPNSCITEIPSVCESNMQQDLESLLCTSSISDSVHDVVLEVGSQKIATHRFVLAERCGYFRTKIAESCTASDETLVLSFDFTSGEQLTSFHHLLTFLYTDTCSLLPYGSKTLHTAGADYGMPYSGRMTGKAHSKGTAFTSTSNSSVVVTSDPVASLKTMAKQFGVTSLVKRLEMVKCMNSNVCFTSSKQPPPPQIRFNWHHYPSLHDVDIVTCDGVTLSCHKCILDARLEYFHGLFSSTWTENDVERNRKTVLQLPVDSDILAVILDYVYTDRAPQLIATDCSLEFLCSVLAVAEQLLIARLKTICEVQVVQCLSLRNVCELLEFADIYNASQLKTACHQFITINLPALLETRSLDSLNNQLVDELTSYYRDSIPGMSHRIITPYSGFPNHEFLNALENDYMHSNSVDNMTVASKRKVLRKRTRQDKPADVGGMNNSAAESPKCHNLLSSSSEADTTAGNDCTPSPTTCPVAQFLSEPLKCLSSDTKSNDVVSLCDIIAAECEATKGHQPKDSSALKIGKMKRVSQNSRKRMLRPDVVAVSSENLQPSSVTTSSSSCPWSPVQKVVQSFKELMVSDETEQHKSTFVSHDLPPVSVVTQLSPSSSSTVMCWGLCTSVASRALCTSVEKPAIAAEVHAGEMSPRSAFSVTAWQRETPVSADLCVRSASFADIVRHELLQTASLVHTTNKSLALIQAEERAMNVLRDEYKDGNSDNHEYITVERVSAVVAVDATPIWAAKQ